MTNPVPVSLIDQVEAQARHEAERSYQQHPLWLVKKGDRILWYLHRSSGLRYPHGKHPDDLLRAWQTTLSSQPFWQLAQDFRSVNHQVSKKDSNDPALIYETATGLAWQWFHAAGTMLVHPAQDFLKKQKLFGLTGWEVPSWKKIKAFRDRQGNPARTGSYYRLYNCQWWLTEAGASFFDSENWGQEITYSGHLMACNALSSQEPVRFWQQLHELKVRVAHPQTHQLHDIPDLHAHLNQDWAKLSFAQIWNLLKAEGHSLEPAADGKIQAIQPSQAIQQGLLDLDYTPCRLPRLELPQLTDPNKGLWELYGSPQTLLDQHGLRARDPRQDLRKQWVAIDFGTSSTVVAIGTADGGKQLLRVGARNFYSAIQPADYENPTVLEFLALQPLLSVWNSKVYRPPLNWNWTRAAHEAKLDYQEHANDPRVVSSVLLHLKRWALDCEKIKVRIVDQQDDSSEYVLAPLQENLPARGKLMQPQANAPLDVVELYAWYLGMAINTRQHGIHLKYAMTFPVKYAQDTRRKIIASFMRGLQRSFPESLLQQAGAINDFEVYQVATEPMAYAVAMLPHLGLQPTSEGVAYAVFDFGGGTTDFDYGLWRLPTPEEEDQEGAEQVFERLGSGGDPDLGGENLLALLAYQVFQDNLSEVYKHKLVFTRPEFAKPFAGSETVLDSTSAARANTANMMRLLRPLLESPDDCTLAKQTIDCRNHSGQSVPVTIDFKLQELKTLVQQRVEVGVDTFLHEMKVAFADQCPARIHLLLAGNASRGKWVREAFDPEGESWQKRLQGIWSDGAPEMLVHFAQGAEQSGMGQPNCKTATALGALDLVRGSPIIQKDHQQSRSQQDAPFGYFVGGVKQGQLNPVLMPGHAYQQWRELGVVRDGVFNLSWSASPRARQGLKLGQPELRIEEINFGTPKGHRCYGRIVSPDQIELVSVAHVEALQAGQHDLPVPVDLE